MAFQGRAQAEIVQDHRPQAPRQPPQLVESLRHQLALAGDGELDLLQGARILGAAQAHQQGRERLAGAVVKLPRDARPLLFVDGDEPLQEGAPHLFVLLAIGDVLGDSDHAGDAPAASRTACPCARTNRTSPSGRTMRLSNA